MRSIRALTVTTILLVVVAACGGTSSANPTATPQPATQPPATATIAMPTATAVSLATATVTATLAPSATATIQPTATGTPVPTPSPTSAPTATSNPDVHNDIIFGDLYSEPYLGPTGPLYAIDADGSDLHPITSAPAGAYEVWPAVSPDGTRVAFTRSFDSAEQRFTEGGVYVVDLESGQEQHIVDGRAQVNWSPDGTRLLLAWDEQHYGPACCGGGEVFQESSKIAVVNADGTNLQVLFEPTYTQETGGSVAVDPRWSPDGTRVLFLRSDSNPSHSSFEQALVVADADGSNMHDVETGSIAPRGGHTWSPDGATIVFAGVDGDSPDLGLYSVAPDGSQQTRLTTPDVVVDAWPPFAYSPDGAVIAFLGYPVHPPADQNYSRLYVIAPDGTGLRQLSPPDTAVSGFAYSPDGATIAVSVSLGAPSGGLLLLTADGNDVVDLGAPSPDTFGLAWSPDSTRLAYLANANLAAGNNWSELRVIDTRAGVISPTLARVRYGEGVVEPVWRPTGE